MSNTVRLGDKGADVLMVQGMLHGHGITSIDLDGIFGPMTKAAVILFQKEHGLVSDGIVGPKTEAELIKPRIEQHTAFIVPPPPFPPMSAKTRERIFGSFSYRAKGNSAGEIEITDNWVANNISKFTIPQLIDVPMYTPNGKLKCKGIIHLHKKAGPAFQRFFDLVEDQNLTHLIRTFDGAFYPRFIRGSKTSLSNHSWGTALDINAYANGLGKKPAGMGEDGCLLPLVGLMHECGLYWGGHFSRQDGMHIEVGVSTDD